MIVEGYDLSLYCDGDHPEWEWAHTLNQFGGRTRKAAWEDSRRAGWTRRGRKVYCPRCSRKKSAPP